MIDRKIHPFIQRMSQQYPVVTITGPRQSGKTTMARMMFPEKPYVNFENLSIVDRVKRDPLGFIGAYKDGAVFDEIQRVPELLSYIQMQVDETRKKGLFVLTGSYQFELIRRVSQSLAGRTALVQLLPFSIGEINQYKETFTIDELMFRGFYPRIYEEKQEPEHALEFYFNTYIERDLRDISRIHDLSLFRKFVRMCAGRVGQLLNLSSLANDVGVSHTTAKEWISILQASYVIYILEPYYANISKRLVKTPKLYFYDVGLAAHLMGIYNVQQIETHPLRGNLFENLVVMEMLKCMYNNGKMNQISFFRDSRGNEVDILYHLGNTFVPIEIKSGQTVTRDYFKGLNYIEKTFPDLPFGKAIIYAGDRYDKEHNTQILYPSKIEEFLKSL